MEQNSDRDDFVKYSEDGAYHWRRTYDAPFWSRGVRLMARYEIPAALIRSMVPEGATGVDIGCGDGVLLHLLSSSGYQMIGIDLAEEGLRQAAEQLRKHGSRADLRQGSAYELPVDSQHCDFVCSVEVIEHMDDVPRYLGEIRRVLKSNGVFVCTTPQRQPGQKSHEVRDPFHVREYLSGELRDELSGHFESVTVVGGYPKKLDRLYQPGVRANLPRAAARLGFRILSRLGQNPYLRTTCPPAQDDELLIAIAR